MMIRPVAASSTLISKAPPGSRAALPAVSDSYAGPIPGSSPAEENSSARGHASTGARVAAGVALALVGLGLAGCGQAATPTPPAPAAVTCVSEHYQQTGDFTVEVIPEDVPRVDVVRGTHTETQKDSTGKDVDVTVDNDYASVGVYLGDGLFYDLNENLVMVPDRAQNGPYVPADASSINIDPAGWYNSTDITRSGSTWTVDPPGWANSTSLSQNGCRISIDPPGLGNSTSVTRDAHGHTSIDRPGWANGIEISRSADQVQIDPAGVANTVTMRLQANRTEVDPPGFGNTTVVTFSPGTARIDPEGWANETTISRSGNVIHIKPPGILARETTITLGEHSLQVDRPGINNGTTIKF